MVFLSISIPGLMLLERSLFDMTSDPVTRGHLVLWQAYMFQHLMPYLATEIIILEMAYLSLAMPALQAVA